MLATCPRCNESLAVDTVVGDTLACQSCGLSISTRSLRESEFERGPATASYHDSSTPIESSRASEPSTMRVGKFAIVELISEGGYGRVYKARDTHTHRLVALKVPRAERFSSSAAFESFLHEARTAVKLEGLPNIIPVYEVDRDSDGSAYIAIKLIEGCTLTSFLTAAGSKNASLVEFVSWLAQVAEALALAHAREVRHRDLKPSNILIDGETRTPWVGDFGLAIHEDDQAKRGNEISGTFAYMSPEQVRGETRMLDGRTDIWSLGVILYERLAGRRPFDARNRQEVFDKILNRPAVPPSQFTPSEPIPQTLEAICLRCLEKNPDDRYSSMEGVARELREWLATTEEASTQSLPSGSYGVTTSRLSSSSHSSVKVATPARVQAPPTRDVSQDSRRARIVSFVAGAAAVAALVIAGAAALQGPPEQPGDVPGEGVEQRLSRLPSPTIRDLDPQTRPGVTLELLAERPQVFRWPDPSDEAVQSSEHWFSEQQRYTLSTTSPALMACGKTQSPSFRFGATLAQRTWTGRTGLFWGAREFKAPGGEAGWIVQAISLKDRRDRFQEELRGLYLVREQMFLVQQGEDLIDRHVQEFGEQRVDPVAPGTHRLVVEVQGGAVVQVQWDEKPLPLLADAAIRASLEGATPDPMSPREFSTQGALGLINSNSTSDFTSVFFRR